MGIPISADAMTPSRNVTEDEMRSNARLIAASPEMLEELRQMVEFLTDSHRGAALHFDTRAARALLAKINAE